MAFRVFSIGDVPVHVDIWFLAICGFYASQVGVRAGLMFSFCLAISILVHEMGHAIVARRYDLQPSVLLTGFGGLCFHQEAQRDRDDALIIVSGPLAGLLLGGLTFVIDFAILAAVPEMARNGMYTSFIRVMLFINIFWSLVNLLPMWPLDGGNLFRLGMLQVVRPALAERVTHGVSIVVLTGGMIWGARNGFQLMLLFGAYLLYKNFLGFSGRARHRRVRIKNKQAKPLVEKAEALLEDEKFEEAARAIHQLRDANNIPEPVMLRAWSVAGVATARLGRHQEAVSYLRRAKPTREVVEASVECFYHLDMDDALDELLASSAFGKLPKERRQEILDVVRPGRGAD